MLRKSLLLGWSVWLFLSLPVSSSYAVDVLTWHNDTARTGRNLRERVLTPAAVNATNFGKLFFITTDGKVDAQPLIVGGLTIPGEGSHGVVFIETEQDTIYACDADGGSILWQTTALLAGETSSDNRGCDQVTPQIGITATPVIDRNAGTNGAIFFVAMSKDHTGNYFQRLHALDLTTGAELFGGPVTIAATYPGTGDNSSNGVVVFDPKQYKERAGLVLENGAIYLHFSSHCDDRPYTGWVMSYDERTLAQIGVLNITHDGSEGAIWQAGAAPALDSAGNIYFLAANGTFDTKLNAKGFPKKGDFGNAFLKLSTRANKPAVADYFTMWNTTAESDKDEDLGSGGAMVLPDLLDGNGTTWHLAVGAGKDAHIYLVNRDSMGKFVPGAKSNSYVYQDVTGALNGSEFASPAYFNGQLYISASGDSLKAFTFTDAKLATAPSSSTSIQFTYPGTTPSISANGDTNAIVWALENTNPAVLHAYDATNLATELYNSNQAAGGRDQFGAGNKFIVPTIANGKVYAASQTGVGVFGLLSAPR